MANKISDNLPNIQLSTKIVFQVILLVAGKSMTPGLTFQIKYARTFGIKNMISDKMHLSNNNLLPPA
jgi:hypothetical protein